MHSCVEEIGGGHVFSCVCARLLVEEAGMMEEGESMQAMLPGRSHRRIPCYPSHHFLLSSSSTTPSSCILTPRPHPLSPSSSTLTPPPPLSPPFSSTLIPPSPHSPHLLHSSSTSCLILCSPPPFPRPLLPSHLPLHHLFLLPASLLLYPHFSPLSGRSGWRPYSTAWRPPCSTTSTLGQRLLAIFSSRISSTAGTRTTARSWS